MDGPGQNDMEKYIFFEATREKCAAEYLHNPHDPENLTKWGTALLELAHYQQGDGSVTMVEDAISKLEAALKINPKKHDTLWSLGNAHLFQGFMLPAGSEANERFKKAAVHFQDAYHEEPTELYLKSLDMSLKAPEMHAEIQAELGAQGMFASSSSSKSSKKSRKSSKRADLVYDVLGWVVLTVGIVAWIGIVNMAKPPVAK